MAAMQYAAMVGLLALIGVTPSYAQSRTAMPDGHPSHYCLPTTVDSSVEEKVYCEGWRVFRKGW
jgi:hypothetical protein